MPGCVSPSGRVSSPSVTGVSHSTCSAAPAGPISGPGVDGGLLSGVTRGPGEEASEQTASLSLFSAFAGLCSLHGSGVLTGGFSSLWAGAPPCTAMWGHPQRRGGSLARGKPGLTSGEGNSGSPSSQGRFESWAHGRAWPPEPSRVRNGSSSVVWATATADSTPRHWGPEAVLTPTLADRPMCSRPALCPDVGKGTRGQRGEVA